VILHINLLNVKLELEGNDHLFWVGNTDIVLEEMKSFILNIEPEPVYEKKLYTVMIGHLEASEDNKLHQQLIRKCVNQHQGQIASYTSQTFTATFEGPSKAVHCSTDLVHLQEHNAKLSLGIDIKECCIRRCICEETEGFAATIFKDPLPNQIIVTQTVKNLLIGTNVSFTPYKSVFKTESGQSLLLFIITEKPKSKASQYKVDQDKIHANDSFLGKVLQNIDHHMSNEKFGVEMLCQEIGISERQLQRKLKSITNKSPNKLISSVRLNRAKELLLKQQHSIAEIAFQAGFTNPSYFSKCFKKEFAIKPSDLIRP